jgi:hypothetical protein
MTVAASVPLSAQQGPPPPLPPAKAYKAVPIQLPKPLGDASHEAFRKQLAGVAQKKDRAGLGRLIAANFFWIDEKGVDIADKKKSGVDNLAMALDLNGRDSPGWEILEGVTMDPTAEPYPARRGVVCGPARPTFDAKAIQDVEASTDTNEDDWYYPIHDGVNVRSAMAANSPVSEKLGLQLVWIYPDDSPAAAADPDTVRIVTPSGKLGFVKAEEIAPVASDQLCYVKEGNAWKIAGLIGGL